MQTRYPILLVHGLAMKDVLFVRAFGSIDRILRKEGYQVAVSRVDSFGSIETNAAALKCEIADLLLETGAEKVNIIAHSKGGLDAEHMISALDMAGRVASLTTLCTPHKGSPVADFVLGLPKWLLRPAAAVVNGVYRLLGDRQPDCLTAVTQLRRVEETLGQETVRFSDQVYCQSFSAVMRNGDRKADFLMRIPLLVSRYMEKDRESDGLVPKDSTLFGTYRGDALDGSVSHTEMVDFLVAGKKRERIHAFYSALCKELVQMGF